MIKRLKRSSASGFTLIELLIVIVIIGILAGVLIAVINPTAQQNKARDANTKATINKVALATSGYISANGRIPNETELLGELTNATANGATCGTAANADCEFKITGNSLPVTCSTGWGGSGANQCYYYYCGTGAANLDSTACTYTTTTTSYRIGAKSFGGSNLFMYNSADSKMYLCAADGSSCTSLYN